MDDEYKDKSHVDEDDIHPEIDDSQNNNPSQTNKIQKLEVDARNVNVDSYNKNSNAEDEDLRVVEHHEKFKVPTALKKTFLVTMALFAIGSILLGLGFIEKIRDDVPGLAISMWTLGGITFIPGGYYAYLFYKACKASGEERDEILEQIPEL
jgi:hypothetical protein